MKPSRIASTCTRQMSELWKIEGCASDEKDPRVAKTFRQDRSWILEDRILLVAMPEVTMGLPTSALVNEEFTFPLTFDNGGGPGDIGYGPYAELIVPPAGSETQQVEILGATYQGASAPGNGRHLRSERERSAPFA